MRVGLFLLEVDIIYIIGNIYMPTIYFKKPRKRTKPHYNIDKIR